MKEIRIENWEQLISELYADSWQPGLKRHRLSRAFRGMSAGDDLRTSLARMEGAFWKIEAPMLRAFRKYARHELPATYESVWDWLAVAQHHGLPTRLLDWTHSPFVAMHFATEGHEKDDGIVWCVDYRAANAALPRTLRNALAKEEADVFSVELLSSVSDTLDGLEGLSKKPFVLFFEPPSVDGRIVNQFALFSLMSSPRARLDEWIEERSDDVAKRIIVPASIKGAVRDFLDQANITERVLFPGLDGLTRYLRRYYTPRD